VIVSIESAARCCRPKALRVPRPSTVSAKRAARRPRVRYCFCCTPRVAQPISTMNRGIRGIVSTTIRPDSGSASVIAPMRIGIVMAVATSCGRYRPK